MCNPTESESGQLLTIKPCGWYLVLKSDRDRLAGVVAGMESQGQRNIEALRRAEGRDQGNAAKILELMGQRDVLKQEREDYRVAVRLAETRETAVHHAINDMRGERDALRAALAPILKHADSHDYAPPLKFSVAACREIKEKVNG